MDSESLTSLKKLIEDGYCIARSEPFTDFPPEKSTKYAVPIHNLNTENKQCFLFDDEDTREFVLERFEYQKNNPIGFKPQFLCIITGFPNNIEGNNMSLSLGNAVREELSGLGFTVDEGDEQKRIFTIRGVDCSKKEDAELQKNTLESYLFNLSISNRLSVRIADYSLGAYFCHSPYSIGAVTSIETLEPAAGKTYDSHNDLVRDIYSYYAQAELRSKLIVGCSILEEYYAYPNRGPLLDTDTKNDFKSYVKTLDIPMIKKERVIAAIENSREKSDNQLIADVLEIDIEDIKFIRKVRGNIAHIPKGDADIKKALDKLDEIFNSLL